MDGLAFGAVTEELLDDSATVTCQDGQTLTVQAVVPVTAGTHTVAVQIARSHGAALGLRRQRHGQHPLRAVRQRGHAGRRGRAPCQRGARRGQLGQRDRPAGCGPGRSSLSAQLVRGTGRPGRPAPAGSRSRSAARRARPSRCRSSSTSPTTLRPQPLRKYGAPRCSRAITSSGSARKRDPEELVLTAEDVRHRRAADPPPGAHPGRLLAALGEARQHRADPTHHRLRHLRAVGHAASLPPAADAREPGQ